MGVYIYIEKIVGLIFAHRVIVTIDGGKSDDYRALHKPTVVNGVVEFETESAFFSIRGDVIRFEKEARRE